MPDVDVLNSKAIQQIGEGINEDSTAFNDVQNTVEEDAYNGASWKMVRNKRRARNAAALEAASPFPNESENPQAKPRLSVAQRLPPLQFKDEKLSCARLEELNWIYGPDQP
ncbi:hypothetical protein MRX96_036739 [Rhipicephalus microplus]